VMSEAKVEAERTRRAAQRQVDELTRQRDSITGHLDQLRHLLGAMAIPGAERSVQGAQQANGQGDEPEGEARDGTDRTITLPAQPETAARR
jgi:hypothetical protein